MRKKIPTKTIVELHEKANRNIGRSVKMGYNWMAKKDEEGGFLLYHYGALIFAYLDLKDGIKMIAKGDGAYSGSDRDAINSMFYILGIQMKAGIKSGVLGLEGDPSGWELTEMDAILNKN